ncbi:hypothetical protein OSTOST_03109 [Ostertagia ostertagi]
MQMMFYLYNRTRSISQQQRETLKLFEGNVDSPPIRSTEDTAVVARLEDPSLREVLCRLDTQAEDTPSTNGDLVEGCENFRALKMNANMGTSIFMPTVCHFLPTNRRCPTRFQRNQESSITVMRGANARTLQPCKPCTPYCQSAGNMVSDSAATEALTHLG